MTDLCWPGSHTKRCREAAAGLGITPEERHALQEGGRPMTDHKVKIWPEPYEAIHVGAKTWEARLDDRGYVVGDTLTLQYYEPDLQVYGDAHHDIVIRITNRQTAFLIPGYVGLSFQKLTRCNCNNQEA